MNKSNRLRLVPLFFLLGLSPAANALQNGLFGNVSISDNNLNEHDSDPFAGQLDFFTSDHFLDDFFYLWEFVYEKTDKHTEAHTERLHLGYDINPQLKVSAGMFHTPFGYWNTVYHHGRILHDSAERPFFMEYEHNPDASPVMPVHLLGVRAQGMYEGSYGDWTYDFLAGNGPELDPEAHHHAGHGDEHAPELETGSEINEQNMSINSRLTFKPGGKNYHIGISAAHHDYQRNEKKPEGKAQGELLEQEIYGFETIYRGENLDAFFEHYWFFNSDFPGSDESYKATAFYGQLSYKTSDKTRTYYRYEQLDFDTNDPYFHMLNADERRQNVLGVRYDVNTSNTIKVEANQQRPMHGGYDSIYAFRLQWAFFWNNPLGF